MATTFEKLIVAEDILTDNDKKCPDCGISMDLDTSSYDLNEKWKRKDNLTIQAHRVHCKLVCAECGAIVEKTFKKEIPSEQMQLPEDEKEKAEQESYNNIQAVVLTRTDKMHEMAFK